MVILRFLLIGFNVAIITFLVYRILILFQIPMPRYKRTLILVGGIILLLVPIGILLGFFGAGYQYLLIYPVAVSLFLYLTKQL